jgi:hypothetical protein
VDQGTIIQWGADSGSITVRWGTAGSGTIRLKVTGSAGCSDSTTLTVSIGTGLKPVILADPAAAICYGTAATLDAGVGYDTYLWSDGQKTRTITVDRAGSYAVTVTDAGGCSGTSDSVRLSVRPEVVPTITPNGPISLCAGDSLKVTADSGYRDYLWSNGATARSITVTAVGSYGVTVTDSAGCTGSSLPVVVQLRTPPARPSITVSGDTLISTPAPAYQWIRNDTALTGETGPRLVWRVPGVYRVRIGDPGGCSAISDPIDEQRVVWLDTVSSRVGTRLRLHALVAPPLTATEGVGEYRMDLRFDPGALFLHGVHAPVSGPATGGPRVVFQKDGLVRIAYSGPVVTGTELFEIEMEGLATGKPANVVEGDSLVLSGDGGTTASNGLVLLSGCDIANGFGFGKRVRIESISPNPAARQITIAYRAPLGSAPRLLFSNSAGEESLRADLPAGNGEVQESRVDVGSLASGLYMLELRDREERSIVPLIITK